MHLNGTPTTMQITSSLTKMLRDLPLFVKKMPVEVSFGAKTEPQLDRLDHLFLPIKTLTRASIGLPEARR